MQKRLAHWTTLLVIFTGLFCPGLAQNSTKLLVGGEQAGPFAIGQSFQTVISRLGRPSSQSPTAADPKTTMRFYKEHQIAFLVNPESKIIGITVVRKDWKTADGLGVGSPVSAFKEVFGKGLKRGNGQLAFSDRGLAVSHKAGVVNTVFIVKRDKVDAAKGDHLLVGGTRAGKLRLGRSDKELLKLLGPPMQKEGRNRSIWVYPDRGIRLGFIQGRLHMVGVTSGDWVTPSGLKVGRPFSEMKRELGKKYRVQTSSVFFDKWGIGARLQGDQIVEILIFNQKKSNRQG